MKSIHYLRINIWTPVIEKNTTFIRIQYLLEPPLEAITTSTLLGMLSTCPRVTACVFFPFGMEKTNKILHWVWMVVASLNSAVQFVREIFDWVQVWALVRPFHSINYIVIMPIHGGPSNRIADVVILEVKWIQPVEFPQHREHIVIENNAVGVSVELTMNWWSE